MFFYNVLQTGLRHTVHLKAAQGAEALGFSLQTAQAEVRRAYLQIQRYRLRVSGTVRELRLMAGEHPASSWRRIYPPLATYVLGRAVI